ncbi:conjugative transposon protein TraN [Pinibacter soli]|uniref:Conjugative transposon protein TraN n=1 Tax=Pinibacter soli TaxID=3044211 RepID=A0ABT6RFL7_9BACT|nr:conjugative transposon protein TraN [Pinibacter soli]MDI3321357.1 conjugative transposon protein TraN [Pinibacter soli]
MKKCERIVMLAMSVLFFVKAHGQSKDASIELRGIKQYALEIGYCKTSNIIFPAKVVSVDRGSQTIIIQRAKGAENILQLKAAKKQFPETNLTIVTADGKFYSFLVNYSDAPQMLNVSIGQEQEKDEQPILLNGGRDIFLLEKEKSEIAKQHSFLRRKHTNQKVSINLRGIYLGEQSMWFSFGLKNKSFIDYKPADFRFFIKDKHRSKRMAVQEHEVVPVCSSELSALKGLEDTSIVVAFIPFTIPSTKRLVISVSEEGGARELVLRIKHNVLVKARPITR